MCNIFGTPRKNSFKICFKFETLQELEVEVELLKEDNEQLVTQYEREKVNNNKASKSCRVMASTENVFERHKMFTNNNSLCGVTSFLRLP